MKSVKVILMTVAAAFMVGSAAAQSLDDAVAKYSAAMEKYQAKNIKEALPLLEEAMKLGIDLGDEGAELVREVQGLLPKFNLQMAMIAAQAKNYDDAVKSFLKAEELADLYGNVTIRAQASRAISNVYMVMGIDSFNNKDFAKALEVFSKGYEQDPKNVKLAAYTAKAYAELNELNKALEIYKGIIETGTSNSKYAEEAKAATADATTYSLVAISEAGKANDLEKVVALTDTLATVVPNEPLSSLMVIQLANNLKKYDIVIARGDTAAEAQVDADKKSDIYFMLGAAYQNKENKAKAIEAFRKVTAGANVAAARTAVADLSK